MPLFEFTCNKCKTDFEELLFGPDISKVICVSCGSKNIVKKMSAFGVKTGGSGSTSGHNCSGCCSHRESCSNSPFSACGH